jgi:hypothetical protein
MTTISAREPMVESSSGTSISDTGRADELSRTVDIDEMRSMWRTASANNRIYYWNTKTRESTYTNPFLKLEKKKKMELGAELASMKCDGFCECLYLRFRER